MSKKSGPKARVGHSWLPEYDNLIMNGFQSEKW